MLDNISDILESIILSKNLNKQKNYCNKLKYNWQLKNKVNLLQNSNSKINTTTLKVKLKTLKITYTKNLTLSFIKNVYYFYVKSIKNSKKILGLTNSYGPRPFCS